MIDPSSFKRRLARALFAVLVASLSATAILGPSPAYCGDKKDPPPPPYSEPMPADAN